MRQNGISYQFSYQLSAFFIYLEFLGVDLYTLFIVKNRIHICEYFLAELKEGIPLKNAIF